MPKSVLPRARAPPPPGPQRPKHGHVGVRISETFRAQNAEICTPPESGGVRISRLSECRNLYSPAPARVPPSPEARARARGSTIFETFKAQKARNLYSPAPAPQRPERARGITISRLSRLNKKPKSVLPRPCPPDSWTPEAGARARGSTIFETFKAQLPKSALPRACARPWTPEAKARARGSTNFETLRLKIMPKSVLPRARGPQPRWTPCKFGKTFTSCHPHLRWSHSSPFRQHWSHTALVSGKSDDETACCSPIPQTFETLVRLPHNLFDVLAALLWQPHELVDVLGAFLWFQPSLPGKG